MKKILMFVLLILCCSGVVFGGEFEDALKKAEQGDAYAQCTLGTMYAEGQVVTQNYKQAFDWFTKSAEQGYVLAQFSLGLIYAEGQGVPQDYKQAYIWFSLSAAQGNKSALKNRDIAATELPPQQLIEAQDLTGKMQQKIDNTKADPVQTITPDQAAGVPHH